jgi:hypothetical protein
MIMSFKSKKRKRNIIFLAILIVAIISVIWVPSMQKNEVVNEMELKDYVKAYLGKYKEIVEANLHLVHDIKQIFFKYNSNPKIVYGIISKNHGAAVVLKYDTAENVYWDIKVIDKPIEYYFWPNMSSELSNLKIVKIASSESAYVLNSQISIKNFALLLVSEGASLYYTGEDESPFKIEGPGAVIIFGELYSKSGLIVKGTNTKHAWSTYQAGLDALKHFLLDCGNQLNETIKKQIEIKHKTPLLLEKVKECLNNKYYKDHPEEFYSDLHELERLGLSEQMKTLLWSKYLELTKEPTLWEKLLDSIISNIPAFIIGVLTTVVATIILKHLGYL